MPRAHIQGLASSLLAAAFLLLGAAIVLSGAASASGEPPVPSAGTDLTVNEDTAVAFSGTATDPESDPLVFSWVFPPAAVVVGADVEFVFAEPGTYTVYLFVNDGTSNESDSIGVEVLDITPPAVDIAGGPDLVADEDTAFLLDGTGTIDNIAVTEYAWTVFDVDTTHNYATSTVSYTWAEPGTYTVTLKAYDDAGNMGTGSATVVVLDITPPVATFNLASAFDEDTFQDLDGTDSTDNVAVVSHTWTISDVAGPVVRAGASIQYRWSEPGTYDVMLAVADAAGNVGTRTVTVTVADVTAPAASIAVASAFDEDTLQTLDGTLSSDNVGVVDWRWTIAVAGGTEERSGATVAFAWATPGTFLVTLAVADAAGNQGTATATVAVNDITAPTAAIAMPLRFKVGTAVPFDATSSTDNVGIDEFTWTFADGALPVELAGATTTYTWQVAGVYLITLFVADAAGNSDSTSVEVTALENIPPTVIINVAASFGEDTAQSVDGSASSDNVGIVSWQWLIEDAGFTATRTATDFFYTWTQPGTYRITLTAADAAENSATASTLVEVLDTTAPVALFDLPSYVGNVALTLDGSSSTDNVGIVAWTWSFEDLSGSATASGATTSYTWTAPGLFLVTLVVADAAGNTGALALELRVVDSVAPTADAGPDQTVDEDTTAAFDGRSSTDNDPAFAADGRFAWTFTDGVARTLTGAQATWVFATPGTYLVTLEARDPTGNFATDTLTVIVRDTTAPGAAFSMPYTLAEDSALLLDGSASADNVGVVEWGWTIALGPDVATRSGSAVSFTFETPGLYTVTLAVLDAAGNKAERTIELLVTDRTAPNALAGADFSVNEDAAAPFDARASTDNSLDFGTAGGYTWFFSDGGLPVRLTGATAAYTFATPGTYPVTLLVVDGTGNVAWDLVVVTVLDTTAPAAASAGGASRETPEDAALTFDASASTDNDPSFGATGTFRWDFGGSPAVSHWGRVAAHTFTQPGTYPVLLTVRDLTGNADTFAIEVSVLDITDPAASLELPAAVGEDLAAELDAGLSTDNVGVVAFTWTVADTDGPHTLTGAVAAYTWATPGVYAVRLVVADAAGLTSEASGTVRVLDTTAPTGTATWDGAIDEGGRATFSSVDFTDNAANFTQTRVDTWSFDEFGRWVELVGSEQSHLFARPGTFTVYLAVADASGNAYRTTFDVLVRDTSAPWITVFSPAEGTLLAEQSVVAMGHFEPGAMLYINGIAVDNLGSFAERVALVEGQNSIAFEVRDAAGNRVAQTLAVRVDSASPAIAVNSPAEGALTNADSVHLQGRVTDASATTLMVQGSPVAVAGDGTFSTHVMLGEGANLIELVALDAAGHRTVLGFAAVRDSAAPVVLAAVVGADLKGGALTTTAASVDLAGTAEPGTTLTLCVQRSGASPECRPVPLGSDGSFRASVALNPLASTPFSLKAQDSAGNVATTEYAVVQAAVPTGWSESTAYLAGGTAAAAAAGLAVGLIVGRRRRRAAVKED